MFYPDFTVFPIADAALSPVANNDSFGPDFFIRDIPALNRFFAIS
jgi:hypothetical protein